MSKPVFDLERLSREEISAMGRVVESIGAPAPHRQAVAERIVRYFYDSLRAAEGGEPACVLVRCFQTSPYARLPLEYRDAADELLERMPSYPDMTCLALLATRGTRLVWNDVATSIHHQCIPLPSVEVVKRAPMIARLLDQIGLPIEQVVAAPNSTTFMVDQAVDGFNVFHVEQALDSQFIPAQEGFVKAYGVRSVLGFGGLLTDGELFVVLLFTRVPISRTVAELFRPLADSVKSALLPFTADRSFQRPHN